ncbi:MAG: TSUP family transporter [Bacilli bacterium]
MIIIYILFIIAAIFLLVFVRDAIARVKNGEDNSNIVVTFLIGFFTDFFDTLGIGSFAPTTALLKFTKQIDEKLLPGTLNVAHTIPIVLEAYIFIEKVEVEAFTLISLILASVIGSYFGAGVISKMEKRTVKIIMGFALFAVAAIMLAGELGFIEGLSEGNTATGLSGIKLVIGIVIFLILGSLMSAGVGLYAPAMATVYILGMSPLVAFPIMMGSCAFLMPIGSLKFIKEKAYAPKVSLAITVGGLIGVYIAANFVTNLDLALLTKIVIGVILLTAGVMLYEAFVKDVKND